MEKNQFSYIFTNSTLNRVEIIQNNLINKQNERIINENNKRIQELNERNERKKLKEKEKKEKEKKLKKNEKLNKNKILNNNNNNNQKKSKKNNKNKKVGVDNKIITITTPSSSSSLSIVNDGMDIINSNTIDTTNIIDKTNIITNISIPNDTSTISIPTTNHEIISSSSSNNDNTNDNNNVNVHQSDDSIQITNHIPTTLSIQTPPTYFPTSHHNQLSLPPPPPQNSIPITQHINSITFSVNEHNQLGSLLFLDESQVLHISGMCSLRLLYGRGNINGYTLKLNEEIQIKSPSWTPAVRLFIEPSSTSQDKNILQTFLQSRQYYEKYSKEINIYLKTSKIVFEIVSVDMLKENWMIRCEDYSKFKLKSNKPSIVSVSSAVIGSTHDLSSIGLESQILPSNWISAADTICKTIKTSPRVVVCGAKGVGKSTTLRYLINRIISKTPYVAVIDCDIGQPEFTPSGLISLHIFSKLNGLMEHTLQLPLLSPPHLHLHQPQLSYFLSDITIKDVAELFEKCIEKLYQQYLLYCEYHSITGRTPTLSSNEILTKEMIEVAKNSLSFNLLHENPYEEFPLPLIVNTDGMIRGMGVEIQRVVFETVKPTHILYLQTEKDKILTSIEDIKRSDVENKLKVFTLTPGRTTPSPIASQDLRDIRLISYFLTNNSYLNQLTQPSIDSLNNYQNQEQEQEQEQELGGKSKGESELNQTFRYPIFIRNAVCIDYSGVLSAALMTTSEVSIPVSNSIFNIIGSIIPPRLILAAFNLSLVGISSFDSLIFQSNLNIQTSQLQLPSEIFTRLIQSSSSSSSSVSYHQGLSIHYTLDDSTTHLLPCNGLGIISEVKLVDKVIQLMTSSELNVNTSKVHCFSRGSIQIPPCLLFCVGGQVSTPYLCSENFGEGSASLSSRTNMKRRSQSKGLYLFPSLDCLESPYLYITFHHNLQGVRKYSRNGCFIKNNVLHGNTKYINEARSVGISKYKGNNALYVCEARAKGNLSKIMVFGGCDRSGGREYLKTVTSGAKNPGVNHPYGITFDKFGNIYVSFQHTNSVLRFKKDTFEPMPYPDYMMKVLNHSKVDFTLYPGTFFEYIYPPDTNKTEGIRDITFVGDNLWIANEDIKGISIVNGNGQEIHRIYMRDHAKPIGLYYDTKFHLVFVSSRSSYGAVYGINPDTRGVEKVYYTEGMTHSTGIVSYEGILYVALQGVGKVVAFDIETTNFIEVVIDHFPDTVEKLALSDC